MMFIVASSASGRGRVAAEETRPSALHPSFRLIWCLVCMTPAKEPNTDNRCGFPPRGASESGQASHIGLDAPEVTGKRTQYTWWMNPASVIDSPRRVKMTRISGFIHIYSTNIHFLSITEMQFTDQSSKSSYTFIYIRFRHFKVPVTSLSTSFVHFFTYVHHLIQYCHSDMLYIYFF